MSFGPLHKEPEIFHTQNILWHEVPLPHTEYSVTWSSTVPLPHNQCAVTLSTAVLIPHTEYSFTGGDGRWLLTGAHNLVQNSWQRTLFPKNWSDNDAKKYRLQDVYDIFDLHVWGKMTKTGQQISWNALLKYILELVACDIHHADKYWIIVGQTVTFLTVYTMILEKYPSVYLRNQAIFIGAWGRCKCKLSYENK